MSAPPLPELADALVDADTVERLFDDLVGHAEILHVIVRGASQRNASSADVPIHDARAWILAGSINGVQVLYRWQGATWRDAILRNADGYRVVRMKVS